MRLLQLLALALVAAPLSLRACPPITPEGTVPGTCDVGSPGCRQGPQCQSRAENVLMPTYHLLGNFTNGVGTQPIAVNDVSAVVHYRGVWHVFHQYVRQPSPAQLPSPAGQRAAVHAPYTDTD